MLPLSLTLSQALALPADTQEAITISAAQAQFDQHTNTLTYEGGVTARQGTTQLMAERVITHLNKDNKIDKLEALGHPAIYSTLTSVKRDRLNASANKIAFNPLLSIVHLIDNAHVSQGGNVMDSPHITIDIAHEKVISEPSALGKTTIVLQPQQRVKSHEKLSRSQATHPGQTSTQAG